MCVFLIARKRIVAASADDDPLLMVLLSLVDLLAACSKGRNVFVQSICQTILPSKALLDQVFIFVWCIRLVY